MKDILIIGSVNIDYSIDCDRFPSLGETVRGQSFSKTIGGKGLNQAIAAFKYDRNVVFCGSVGNDQDAHMVEQQMQSLGMRLDYLETSREMNTGLAMILRFEGDNSIVIHEGANGVLNFERVQSMITSIDIDYVILQMELPHLITHQIIEYCHQLKIKVVLNTAPAREIADEDLAKIDTLMLNQSETQYYTSVFPKDEATAQRAAQYFIDKGVRHVIITLGSEGCFYLSSSQTLVQKAYPCQVVDTTGAGDAFAGVYVSALNETGDIAYALRCASAAGSLTCENVGASQTSPTRIQILNKLMEEN